MKKAFKLLAEFCAAFVAIAVVLTGVFAWVLSFKPMEATSLTPYVQMGLTHLLPDLQPELGATRLIWDNKDRSFALRSDDVTFKDKNGQKVISLPFLNVRLSVIGLLNGHVIPEELGIDNLRVAVVRSKDGNFSVGQWKAEGGSSSEGQQDLLQKLLSELTHQEYLHELKIRDLILYVHDDATAKDFTFSFPEVALSHTKDGMNGNAKLNVSVGDVLSHLIVGYSFDQRKKIHTIEAQFDKIIPASLPIQEYKNLESLAAINLSLSGKVKAVLDEQLQPQAGEMLLTSGEGKLNMPDLWDEPRYIKAVRIQASFDKKNHKLDVKDSLIDFGGPQLALSIDGDAASPESGFDEAFSAKAQVIHLPMAQFAAVWPKIFVPGARDWIATNMTAGEFAQGDVTVRGKFKWDDIAQAVLDSGEGRVTAKNGNVQFLPGAPLIEGVNADATFDLNHMDVKVSGGGIGALRLQPSTITLSDFEAETQHIVIPLKMVGPAREVLRVLDAPPLGYAKAVGLKQDDLDGKVEGLLDIRLPLLKDIALKDVAIKSDAKITDFSSSRLVPSVSMTQGQMQLALDGNGFKVTGPVFLNKVSSQISWQQNFSPAKGQPLAQATVNSTIAPEGWNNLGVDFMSKVEGSATLVAHYTSLSKSFSRLTADINLKQSGFTVDQLNWTKATGAPLSLSVVAEMVTGKPVQIKAIDMQGAQVKVRGVATLDEKTGRLLSADIKPLMLGRTNASVRFAQGAEILSPMRFQIVGDSFDASGLTGGRDPAREDDRSKDYSVTLEKLYTSDTGFLSNLSFHAVRDIKGWADIDLHGLANGTHALDIKLVPQLGEPQKRVFSITCDSFGDLLKGMGFSDAVKDGSVTITGESSAENPRTINGTAKIGSFSVSDLPVLARLTNALSLFGILDLMTGQTTFNKLEGGFSWYGDRIDLKDVRVVGSVVGVKVDGSVDLNTGNADLKGTVVPFSFVNKVLNAIPLVGSIITGGDGEGVIGASYALKGDLNNPQLSVNPVSLLAPGFLRDLFFGG